MKNGKVFRIFSIVLILTLLLIALPVLPTLGTTYTYALSLSPTQGRIGDTIAVRGTMTPAPTSSTYYYTANVYLSPTNIAIGANLTTSSLYYLRMKEGIIILSTQDDATNAGNFTTSFVIPTILTISDNPLAAGSVSHTMAAGTYYVYFTTSQSSTSSSKWIIAAKATLTITAPALDALSPASGPPSTLVTVSGTNLPASTTLAFKFDTTTITPTSGHTATTVGGLFLSRLTIPSTATAGAHTITVTAGTTTLTATFTVTGTTTSPTTSAAAVSLSAASGPPGSVVTVTGSSFPDSTALFFRFDSTTISPTGGDMDSTQSTGIFITQIIIPSTATAGAHIISATAGTTSASATYTVTTGTTTPTTTASPLSLDRTSGPTGIVVSVHGSGFIPSHAFTVSYNKGDGTTFDVTGTVGTDGFFFASLTIPASAHGVHTITASDGTNTAAADYTVESATPAIPQPERPYMNEAVSPPVIFDWADATDESTPVTYKFQVATDAAFTTDSIVIDKSGLGSSTYTLTESDLVKLNTNITYFWREKAVDGALNESGWTGANQFSLSQPFSFTGWPLYLTIGVGAFLLFLIGIWLGRRSAYNY
jgi:hypothetical protein